MVSVAQATDYDIRVATSDLDGAETNANVHIIIMGEEGDTSEINLDDYSRNDFERGAVDDFQYSAEDVGVVTGFQVKRDTFNPYGVNPDWHFDTIGVKRVSAEEYLTFHFGDWLPANEWVKFPRPECGDVGHTCYYENDPCPSGTEECVKYECLLDGNKCCCNV
ncbi:hypothetical protein ABFA07_017661 [Porites harrisoni]